MSSEAESAFRHVTESGCYGGAIVGAVSFLTGWISSMPSDNMISLTMKIVSADCSVDELMSLGVLPAAIAIGRVAIPVLLFVWTMHGLFSSFYGICSSTAPLLYGISLTEISFQLACFVAVASYLATDALSRTVNAIAGALREGTAGVQAGLKSAADWSGDKARRSVTNI
ncbi:cation-transporting ATPase [Besnoitia besnoiti]|uniref:Cation-transporting ATPase n=1 Tax=Besnoitia besnoiti TaxID=94643 RepID=A0A2A9MKA0_BESBE|nr:cation-transporting ATPase [Besnoitia besnoiti]PFH36037.1 cation-transporting ATPase [Besnoitia besnoiti]